MVYGYSIEGRTVTLRAVEISDAPFIVAIRNSELAKHLHTVDTSVEAQEKWIAAQREREGDYYFMVLDQERQPIGTVGLSSIERGRGETSRFISYGSPLQNTETNLLITDFAFGIVGVERIEGYVAAANISVISLQKKFGYVFEDEVKGKDGMGVRFARLDKESYLMKRPKIMRIIERVE